MSVIPELLVVLAFVRLLGFKASPLSGVPGHGRVTTSVSTVARVRNSDYPNGSVIAAHRKSMLHLPSMQESLSWGWSYKAGHFIINC